LVLIVRIEEEKYLKQAIYKRVTDVILPSEGERNQEDLIDIINKKFPDFRAIIVDSRLFRNRKY
jgi:hypothetical protein